MDQQTQPQATNQEPPRIIATTRSKLPFVLIFILLLILIPTGIFIYGKVAQKPAPNPSPIVLATPTPTPSSSASNSAGLKNYESKKLKNISFSGYSLSYPNDWKLSEERDETALTAKATLEKESYAIVIQQGAFDGGLCVYKDSDLPTGGAPYSDKRKYDFFDLKTGIGNLRRDEEVGGSGEIGYAFCQENATDGSFGSLTKVGAISFGGPAKWDPSILPQMDEVIKSIKPL